MTRLWPGEAELDHTVYGRGGACATSHPLAARAGISILEAGGNAVDAAVGMAAALTVVEPTSNGIGGDAFALVWAEEKLWGLNGSGRSPGLLTRDALRAAGHDRIPARGWIPVTVPGAPLLWHDLHRRFGARPFSEVLAPAIRLAETGHPVAPLVSRFWRRGLEFFDSFSGTEFDGWRSTFAPRGRTPAPGEVAVLADHAHTLQRMAESGAEDFYRGELARRIDAYARQTGGFLRAEDLARHRSEWMVPLSVSYRDAEIWEIPPNGQGVVALSALRTLDGLPPGDSWDDPEGVHRCLEAVKLAFADAQEHVSDPATMAVSTDRILDEMYLAGRRESIGTRAVPRTTGLPRSGGTVLVVTGDAGGMMVSLIQSNYMGFGSGVVVPGTGIALQNRGVGFSPNSDHPNSLGPDKRPFHTLAPGFLTRNGKPWGPLGVMGGHMQPQGHVQVVRALVDFGSSPQRALDLPRWMWQEGLEVEIESGWPRRTVDQLRAWGHEIRRPGDPSPFGRGQIILQEGDVYAAGSDRRADGQALVL